MSDQDQCNCRCCQARMKLAPTINNTLDQIAEWKDAALLTAKERDEEHVRSVKLADAIKRYLMSYSNLGLQTALEEYQAASGLESGGENVPK